MINKKLRKSARDQDCLVRIPGVCNFDPKTTVLAHINGGGMGLKQPDYKAAFCCSSCHAVIDGHVKSKFSYEQLISWHWQAVGRTWDIWIEQGLIEVRS